MTVLDYMELSALFAKELPQALFITPSLLREYLLNIPGVLKSIEAIFIGGERLSLDDIIMSQSLIKGTVFSVYGPTENTGFSTSYAVDIRQPCTNGVPIGRPLTNSGAHVLDRSNKRVPVGVIGELVVTGDGLARGYTDSRLDAGRFVTISLGQGQQNIRAYRTGDHVRCRPQNGQLEFYGRIDGQVKIRGQRVELAEIEHALKRDHQVADAVALLYRDAKNAPQLAAFASIRDTVVDADALNLEDRENSKEAQHEDVWEEVFDADTYVAINDIKPGLIGRDFVGWTSMYDGSEIDKGEMSEWLDDTMNDILCSTEEGLTNVLEIGSGSGMILFNLPSDSLISYTGLDPSAQAINFVNKAVKQMPEFEGKVHMFKGTAMDIGPLDQLGSPDTVIFNSVLQYFPSQEYLAKVIEYLLRITSVRTIYIGDIRSYALYHQFLASRALFMAGDETKPNEVRRMMEDMERAEREFLVDPAFFTKLVFRFPDLVGHVEILPKKMRANNELSRYRYAAVIHTKSKLAGAPVHEIKTTEWLDYVKDGLTSDGLKELLRRQNDRGSPMIAVSNIPYDKTIEERYIMEELNKAKHNSQLERNWVYQAREKAKGSQSLSAMKLRDLAHGAGYGLELSCARQFSQHGGLDAVFYHVSAADDKGEENQRRLFQFPTDHEGRPQHLFSNRPLRQQMAQSIRERLDKSLVRELPSYMIPQSIVVLESLPVNANGKTDRKALAEMVQTRVMERQSIRQAVTPAERAMQGIWAHALDLASDKIGLDDSFFKLGGDSLAAMRVVGEARKQGFQLQVADVFRSPQLGDLAAHMVPSDDRAMSSIPTRAGKGAEERQSYAQERLWFLDQLHPGLDWYLMPFATRLHGRLNTKALEVALLAIEQRQETLRTTFYSADGINFQVVQPFIEKKLTIIDLSHSQPKQTSIDGFLERDRSTPINLKQEAGWRVNLYKLSQDEHVLSIVMHHIVSDGWSIDVLRRQLAELYSEAVRGEDILSTTRHLPIQYRDFSVWQRDQEQASGHKEQLDYWLEQLRDSRPAEFPCDLIRPPSLSGKADVQSMRIEGPVYTKLQHFCKQRGLTPFVVLLAAFRVAHLRLTGATDATIGMPNANRDRWELKDMIGFFVNVQCLRLQAEPTDSFDSLIERVQETTTASFANQDVPFERIVSNLQKDRDVSRNPLVQVMFAFHAQKDLGNFTLEGVETEAIARGITSRFDMEMHFFQEKDAFQGQLIFSTDLFIPENISAILSVLSKVIEEALDDTTLPIDILPLMTDEGYSGLVNMGLIEIKKTTYPADSTIVDVFCQQVSETPTRVAVKDALAQMTYSDLDLRSDMIARWISARTYPPETLVGVFVKRSCEAIAIFLGILKAGLAYLPFDIKTPVRRIQTILSSIPGHHLILVGGGLELPRLEMTDVELMYIPGDFDHLPSQNTYPMVEPTAVSSSNKLAYVMFTSGSTGKPKGVKATHRGVIRLCKNNSPLFDHMPHSGIMAHASNLAFDASTWEIYATILNGGTLICIDTEILLDPIALRPVFDDERIQMLFITPALLKQYLEESPELISSLETLLIGGERLNPHTALAAQNLVQGNFLHVYGPTENTGFSTCYHFRGRSHDRCANGVAIGRAIDNSGAYVMDAKQRLVPLGVIGELVVTGDGLAQGYTDKARNRDRFVNVVVGGEEIAAYRTGDYVRYRPTDGQLEFYGRMDGQVKIRGQRVELSEIEQHVSSHGRVENSVAILHGNEGQEPTLTCFVTLSTEASGEMPSRAVGDGHEEEKIEQVWEDMFDADTYTDIASAKPEAVGRDFIGWTSMYDGSNIPVEEMDEWLQDTMMSLLASGPATDVLEIGTGSGMILFNLVAKSLHGYIGLEPSERAVGFVMRTCQIMPDLNGKVKVYKATAAELPRLNLTPTSLPPTLAVINSVAQYFPSQDYLLNTIKELLAMGVKQIFLGDIRSFALYEQFLASRALFMFKNIPRRRVGKEELRRMINDMKQIERELLVDPFFFTSLPSRLPQLIGHVEVFPKRMRATNELSRYRYTVVIHGSLGGQGQPSIHGVPSNAWQDFREMGVGRDELAELVKSSVVHSTVCIRNIPDSKTIFETRLVDALRSNSDDDMNWLTAVQREAANLLSLSAVDLEDIARQAGCEVEINCGLQRSQKGGLDAIFHQIPPSGGLKRTLFQFPTDSSDTPLRTLSSQPLRQQELNQVRDELFHKLQTELPSYMVPKAICFLDSLPVNDNGKIDRRQLEKEAVQVTTKATDRGSTQQPTTECERQMQSIWAQILNIDSVDIGVQDSFFHLGGDSLAAMKVVGLARKSGMQISVADIFRQPCLQDICASVEDGKPSSRDQTITSLAKSNVTQQSFAQERLWFMEQLHPGLTWYLMPCAMRVRGPIQVEALNMAIAALISRHETLRTIFSTKDDLNLQRVQDDVDNNVKLVEVPGGTEGSLRMALQREQTKPFDLEKEPGWRVTLLKLNAQDHVLSIMMHHIISDGWSVEVLRNEMAILYSAALQGRDLSMELDPLPVQYRDYAVWQREQDQLEESERQLEYWSRQIEFSRPAEFICDKPRPSRLSGEADVQQILIADSLYEKLEKYCQVHGVTKYVVLLAIFRLTHFRMTGSDDAVIGAPNANRDRWEIKDMIGFFVNLQCIRIKVQQESFDSLIQHVKEVTTASFANQDVPFERLVAKLQQPRSLSRNPLAQITFALHSQVDISRFDLEGLETEPVGIEITSRFDMEFHFFQEQDRLRGQLIYSTDLFESESVAQIIAIFCRTLESVLEDSAMPVHVLPLIDREQLALMEKMALVEVTQTTYPWELSVVDVFRQQVTQNPEAVAVAELDSANNLTYRQLDGKSNQVAAWLHSHQLPSETLIGVFADRSALSIIAVLGILKANMAYIPFDIRVPEGRMMTMLSSISSRKLILTGDVEPPCVHLTGVDCFKIRDVLEDQLATQCESQLIRKLEGPTPDSLAYVMFTSGSTGQPKGVMIEHRGIVRLAKDSRMLESLPPSPTVAHLGNMAFDASTWEIFTALLNGGTLVCIDTEALLEHKLRHELFTSYAIQAALFTPALLKQCLLDSPTLFAGLETLVIGGDRVDPRDLHKVRQHMKTGTILNAYGPTENTVASTIYRIPVDENNVNGVPIGRALSNSGAYVMDDEQRLVPLGVAGELVVTGDGLARGYTDPTLNQNRFLDVTVAGKTQRGYRTGDYVRYRPRDGQLEYMGRIDGQIKIRGQRVELGEIEHILKKHESVDQGVTLLSQSNESSSHLAAFITLSKESQDGLHAHGNAESGHENAWQDLFDNETYTVIEDIDKTKIGRDFTGWTSMYDGEKIDEAEMDEWLDDVVNTILENGGLGNVLEIGSGSGMIAFNIADHVQSYTGIEPSKSAADFILKASESMPALKDRVRMIQGTAADVGMIRQLGYILPDTVILNSVLQYFPSQDYLFNMVENLAQLGSAQTIFIGDIRSYALYRQFLASRVLHMTQGTKPSREDVKRMMEDMSRAEKEFLVDPAFFTGLKARLKQVEHVEIIPKKMQATNELSSYRYAARIHLRAGEGQSMKIHAAPGQWVHFVEQGLTQDSLHDALRQIPAASPGLAVANIPHRKTLLERHMLESLDETSNEEDNDWFSTVQHKVERQASLSAVDIGDMAKEVGLCASMSWARQSSQNGGIDVIFYRPHDTESQKPLFEFPTDDGAVPTDALANRPMWQQISSTVRGEVMEVLKSQLPSYMVPQTITVLDNIPINQNGKVDRQALGKLAIAPTVKGVVRQPRSNTEEQIRAIWAHALGVKENDIGLDDNFFRLGGDSMTAMRVAGEARKRCLDIVVADIFRFDNLEQLANRPGITKEAIIQESDDMTLIESSKMDRLLVDLQGPGIPYLPDDVVQILPSTSVQEGYVFDDFQFQHFTNYFYLDLGETLDVERFKNSCMSLVDMFLILRTCFLRLQGSIWQVVLRDAALHIDVTNVHAESLDQSSNTICQDDWHKINPRQLPTAFMLIKHETEGFRLLMRLQHAQYDGVSLPIILQSLLNLYHGIQPRVGPSFSRFLAYAANRRDESLAYWKQLLAGSSSSTRLEGKLGRVSSPESPLIHVGAETEVPLPDLGGKITSATVASAAWAVLLSVVAGATDVIYGHRVAGRNSTMDGIEDVVAPCLNVIPVRVQLSPSRQTVAELLHAVQEQFLAVGEADSVGYKDVMRHATDWHTAEAEEDDLEFGTVIQHQNVDENPEISMGDATTAATTRVGYFSNPLFMWRSIVMVSYPRQGDRGGNDRTLLLRVGANSHIMSAASAQKIVDALGDVVGRLCGGFANGQSLEECMAGLEVDLTG